MSRENRKPSKRPYRVPRLERRERLSDVAEGDGVVVTDGRTRVQPP